MRNSFIIVFFLFVYSCKVHDNDSIDAIRPYEGNQHYWQYKGEPVLLIGGTNNDNLFQIDYLESHLDSLKLVGGNYVRNTMSDRDKGDLKACAKTNEGLYDIRRWNDKYWEKFEELLRLTNERDIFVQIEIWDRFDHSRQEWLNDPFNPKNNINYTYETSGFDSLYPNHPNDNKQPFFFTVPALQNNVQVLQYQQAFVKKLLSYSLQYNNVLYCIDNETSADNEWATYWSDFIKKEAGKKIVCITEMWDHWDVFNEMHKRTMDHPERYSFVDISQNSHQIGYANWLNAQKVFEYLNTSPRPVNSTKIYGNDIGKWAQGGKNSDRGVQPFLEIY